MKKVTYDKASRTLGITLSALLILVSIVVVAQLADIPNSGSNNISDLNKSLENDIKIQEEAIGINPRYAMILEAKKVYKNRLNNYLIFIYF
jgi:hypothetical protein